MLPIHESNALSITIRQLAVDYDMKEIDATNKFIKENEKVITEHAVVFLNSKKNLMEEMKEAGVYCSSPDVKISCQLEETNLLNIKRYSLTNFFTQDELRYMPLFYVNIHTVLPQDISTRLVTSHLMREEFKKKKVITNGLAHEICQKFGTIKYVLTQFPELKCVFKNYQEEKINKNYKVPPRSSFANCDAFVDFFGTLAMEGIRP